MRKDAPRPADMTALLPGASTRRRVCSSAGHYAKAIPLLEQILAADPHNLDAALRLATAHSMLGHDAQAVALFERAAAIAPKSPDVRDLPRRCTTRGRRTGTAPLPLLEQAVVAMPDRVAALEALVEIHGEQGDVTEAIRLRQKIDTLRTPTPADLVQARRAGHGGGADATATTASRGARALQGASFTHDLDLGVLYLAAQHFDEARTALDRVASTSPDYPMALFKRAQVSVLLREPDAAARIEAARKGADADTRPLIERERLFQR